jgi:hypothetical protein
MNWEPVEHNFEGRKLQDIFKLTSDTGKDKGYLLVFEGPSQIMFGVTDSIKTINISFTKPRCLYCGCVLSGSRQKYCDKACRTRYRQDNPKQHKVYNILKEDQK